MKGIRIGYVRVSSADQNPGRQLEGVQVDKVFSDQATGKNSNRPGLDLMLEFAREGDTVVVHSMDRLARNLVDLRRLVHVFTYGGVKVEFIKENLTFSGDDAPISTLLLSVMGAFAEFERELIKERQREGLAIARAKGLLKGRPPALSPEQVVELRRRAAAGEKKVALAQAFGIGQTSIYKYLRSDPG